MNCFAQLPTGTSFYGTGEIGGASERSGKRVSMVLRCKCNLVLRGYGDLPFSLEVVSV